MVLFVDFVVGWDALPYDGFTKRAILKSVFVMSSGSSLGSQHKTLNGRTKHRSGASSCWCITCFMTCLHCQWLVTCLVRDEVLLWLETKILIASFFCTPQLYWPSWKFLKNSWRIFSLAVWLKVVWSTQIVAFDRHSTCILVFRGIWHKHVLMVPSIVNSKSSVGPLAKWVPSKFCCFKV